MEEILTVINKSYEVGVVTLLHRVSSGYLSNNYILENQKERYFLKQYRFENIDRIKEVHRVKFFFSQGGIPVILPIQNKKGNYLFSINNTHYALFPFISGKEIERDVISEIPLISMGKMLADIHLLSRDGYPMIVKKEHGAWETSHFLSKAESILKTIEKIKDKESFDRLAIKVLRAKISLAQNNNIRFDKLGLKNDHIIHGDYHNRNIFFDDNDHIKYVFDIEKTGLAPRVFEVVRSMTFTCFDGEYKKKRNFNKAAVYIKAYHNKYPIRKEELREGIIYYNARKFHSLWVESEHYLKNSRRVDGFLEKELGRLQYFSRNLEQFIEFFENELF